MPKELDVRPTPQGPPKYFEAYTRLEKWTEDALDIYKPEVQRLLWPFFIYSYLLLVTKLYAKEAEKLFQKFSENFRKEHEYDLRSLKAITTPEHTGANNIAKLYLSNKYRLSISTGAFQFVMQFLESLPKESYELLIEIVQKHLDLRQVDRASDDRFSFASIILRGQTGQDMPAEDEGIPGHRPGNAISSTDPNVGQNLANLKLGTASLQDFNNKR